MVAAKKTKEENTAAAAAPEAAPAKAASAAAPGHSPAERAQLLEKLRTQVAEQFDIKKRDALGLLAIALAFADNPNTDTNNPCLRGYGEILRTPTEPATINEICQEYKKNPLDIFDHFTTIQEQSILLTALHYCLDSAHFEKRETALNYSQIQKSVHPIDVFRDIITHLVHINIAAKKREGTPAKHDEILKELLHDYAGLYEAKEASKPRYMGYWKAVLDRSDRYIQELQRISETQKNKATTVSGTALDTQYTPYSMVKNALLDKIDKDIHFTQKLSENDAYTLLGVVGHAASADGQSTDQSEAQYLKDLILRLNFKMKKEHFSASIAQNLEILLGKVNTPELARAIYYETMCMMTSNLEITLEEKTMLNVLAETFKLTPQDTLLIHTRHYLDSGLKGVEDSLQAMPVQLKSAHHSLHRYQEVLTDLAIVPLADIVATGKKYLENMEAIQLPASAPAEVRVAVLSLVGNSMRLDDVFDDNEKAFLQKTMLDLNLTGQEVKTFPLLMKKATLPELCFIIKKWAIAQKKQAFLPAVAYYVLRAISADGVIDANEDKFKNAFFRELDLEHSIYARMLLRVQLDFVN